MRYWLPLICLVIFASSCTINKNIMFKTDREFVYDQPADSLDEYRLSPNDRIVFRLFTNKGDKLLQGASITGEAVKDNFNILNEINYTIQPDSTVKLPIVESIKLAGLTLLEAESYLEEMYTPYYNKAFAQILLLNNRVIVFPGSGGDAVVIPLQNRNTTIIEALASAGGISERGDASKVKLIRKIPGKEKPDIYLIDLSTIEGIALSQMPVQAYDVVYVEPVPEIASEVLKDLAPLLTLVSTFSILAALILRNSN